jgi:hypothetical protein
MVLGNFADSHLPVSFFLARDTGSQMIMHSSKNVFFFFAFKESMSQEQNFEEA